MKILYGVQGTGNGHISRARFIYKYLKNISNDIDVLISGNNYNLKTNIPIKFNAKGFTFAITNGKIDYLKTLSNFDLFKYYLDQKEIEFKNYDLIITDFEPISAWGSVRYNIPSIHISHQASFIDQEVPRPSSKNIISEYVMKHFCPASDFIGLHYESYSKNISEPIIAPNIINAKISTSNHITIYLPWYHDEFLYDYFKSFKSFKFHIFSKETLKNRNIDNISFFPIDNISFIDSLKSSYGVICNAGFQTTSEAISMGKRLLAIPVDGQYEQYCNVVALKKLGISSLELLDEQSKSMISKWIKSDPVKREFNNTVEKILESKINNIC